VAKQAVQTGKTITELALAKRLLAPQQLKEILNPRRMTEPAAPLQTGRSVPTGVVSKRKKKATSTTKSATRKASPRGGSKGKKKTASKGKKKR